MSAETDIARAWYAKWNATATIVAAVPGGLHTDEVQQPQATVDDADRDQPYAILKVEPERQVGRHGGWTDFHRVTVELYGDGTKASVGTAVSLILETFCWKQSYAGWRLDFSGFSAHRAHGHTKRVEDKESPTTQKRRGRRARLARLVFQVLTDTTSN